MYEPRRHLTRIEAKISVIASGIAYLIGGSVGVLAYFSARSTYHWDSNAAFWAGLVAFVLAGGIIVQLPLRRIENSLSDREDDS